MIIEKIKFWIKRLIKLWLIPCVISIVLVLILERTTEEKKSPQAAPKIKSEAVSPKKILLPYEIVEKKDISYAGTSRMTNRVLLETSQKPKEQEMKDVASSIWKDGNKSWDEFTVFIYLPKMDTQSIAYAIAEFSPKELVKFEINEWALDF